MYFNLQQKKHIQSSKQKLLNKTTKNTHDINTVWHIYTTNADLI